MRAKRRNIPSRSGQRATQKRQIALTSFLFAEQGADDAAIVVLRGGLLAFLAVALLRAIEEAFEPVHHAIETRFGVFLLLRPLLALVENRLDHAAEFFDGIFFLGSHRGYSSTVGVTIDLGGDKLVEIATAEDLTAHFVKLYQYISDSSTREEIPQELLTSKTTPAAAFTYTYLDLGGPKVGWLWDVMRLSVNGNDPTATIAGTVWAFLGSAINDKATIEANYPQIIEVGTGTIPNSAFYGRQQVIVRPGQHIYLGLKGLPNATIINGGGEAIQYRDPAAGQPSNPLRKPK